MIWYYFLIHLFAIIFILLAVIFGDGIADPGAVCQKFGEGGQDQRLPDPGQGGNNHGKRLVI